MTEFTVLTYNAGNERARPDRLALEISKMNADLVALEELSDNQAQAVARQFKDTYPHQALFPGGFAGKAVLSRYPIQEAIQLYLGPERPDLLAKIDLEGALLNLIVAHPPPPMLGWRGIRFHPSTWEQIEKLAELATQTMPSILLGDFNLIDKQWEYRYLRSAGLRDAFQEAGRGAGQTLPKRLGPWKRYQSLHRMMSWIPLPPMVRVDYIFFTDPLTCIEAWVGTDAGSDHLPVLARLAW